MKLRLMSYNLQSCHDFTSREIVFSPFAEVIRSLNADIIGLQEVRGQGLTAEYTDQVGKLGELLGYHAVFARAICFGGTEPYGIGLLSRYPILESKMVSLPYPQDADSPYPEDRMLLSCIIEVEGQQLTINNTHLGVTYREQEVMLAQVMQHIPAEKTVLMGDFNMTPDCPLLRQVSNRLEDTATVFKEPKLSFPSDFPDRRIDYIFASRDISVVSADIPSVVRSDHRPYIADIIL